MDLARLLLAVVAVTPFVGAAAQEPGAVTVGDRVRVSHDCATQCREDKGTIDAIDAGSIVLSTTQDPSSVIIPIASVAQLSVSRGQKSQWITGAVIGGVALGAATAAAVINVCDPWGNPPTCSISDAGIVAVTAAGAAVGVGLGAALGSLFKSDRWEDVPVDQLRVSIVPRGKGRFGLGVSASF